MKLLTLIRHAKSDWDDDLYDFDRPLSDKGKEDAPAIGDHIFENLPKPDLVISSPAFRTMETAEIIAEKIGYPKEKISFVDELYLCSISEYIEVLLTQSVKVHHIMIISHNPGTTGFVNLLTDNNIADMPPCGVAHIKLDLYKWEDVEPGTGELVKYFTPDTL